MRDTVAQGGFGEAGLGPGGGKARLGLGNVRPGHFADVEAVAGLPELFVDHLDVVALQVENGGVAQDVHIGRRAIEQNALLGGVQGFPRTEDGGFRRPDPVRGPVAVEERLIDLDPKPTGDQRISACRIRREPRCGRLRLHPGPADVGYTIDLRAVAGLGLRNGFVGCADTRALSVDVGIVAIGARQSALQGLGRHPGRARQHEHRGHCPKEQAIRFLGVLFVHAHLPSDPTTVQS